MSSNVRCCLRFWRLSRAVDLRLFTLLGPAPLRGRVCSSVPYDYNGASFDSCFPKARLEFRAQFSNMGCSAVCSGLTVQIHDAKGIYEQRQSARSKAEGLNLLSAFILCNACWSVVTWCSGWSVRTGCVGFVDSNDALLGTRHCWWGVQLETISWISLLRKKLGALFLVAANLKTRSAGNVTHGYIIPTHIPASQTISKENIAPCFWFMQLSLKLGKDRWIFARGLMSVGISWDNVHEG